MSDIMHHVLRKQAEMLHCLCYTCKSSNEILYKSKLIIMLACHLKLKCETFKFYNILHAVSSKKSSTMMMQKGNTKTLTHLIMHK